jgi:hypothetical protein
LPGGSRLHTPVWIDGKAPRYWVVMAVALLLFSLSWVLIIHYLHSFATTKPDAMHSLSMMTGNHVQYYPRIVVWVAEYGLFVVMVWMFILALIMAFKRRMVLKENR